MKHTHSLSLSSFALLSLFALSACGGAPDETPKDTGKKATLPDVEAATFVSGVDNPLFPLPVGAQWIFEANTDEGLEHIEVTVTDETRDVNGVTAMVVRDVASLDGVVVEDTDDWFAQDDAGNVWYLGESTCTIENGDCVDTHGSWEYGVDGALPGVQMWANPAVSGEPYYQEFLEGEAEDQGEIVAVDASITVDGVDYTDCVRTKDTTALEPDQVEFKTYCAGTGLVREEEDGDEVNLIDFIVGG